MTETIQTKKACLKKICDFTKSKLGLIIIGIVVLLLAAGGFAYWYLVMRIAGNVISYIPNKFDQVFYMKIDNDFKSLLDKVDKKNADPKIFESIKTINEVAAFEYLSGDQKISYMVAKVNSDFNLQKTVDAGLINTGDAYEFKKISSNLFVYGDKDSVDFALKYKGDNISKDAQLKSKVDDIVSGKYNFAVFTKANTSRFTDATILSKFLQKLGYGSFMAHVGDKRNYGELGILFNQAPDFGKDYKFDSTLGNYLNTDNIIFAEIGNLLNFLGVNKDQVSLGISALFSEIPNAGTIMTQDDYAKLAAMFDGNIGVSLTKSNNVAGVGLAMIFEKGNGFDVINKLFPYLKMSLDEQIKQSGMTGLDIKYVEEANKIGANISYPYMGGIPLKINVVVEKQGENMLLEIMDPNVQKANDKTLKSTSQTVANFFVDSGKIVELYNKFAMLNPSATQLPNLDLFKDKKVYGTLDFKGDTLLLKYDTQN